MPITTESLKGKYRIPLVYIGTTVVTFNRDLETNIGVFTEGETATVPTQRAAAWHKMGYVSVIGGNLAAVGEDSESGFKNPDGIGRPASKEAGLGSESLTTVNDGALKLESKDSNIVPVLLNRAQDTEPLLSVMVPLSTDVDSKNDPLSSGSQSMESIDCKTASDDAEKDRVDKTLSGSPRDPAFSPVSNTGAVMKPKSDDYGIQIDGVSSDTPFSNEAGTAPFTSSADASESGSNDPDKMASVDAVESVPDGKDSTAERLLSTPSGGDKKKPPLTNVNGATTTQGVKKMTRKQKRSKKPIGPSTKKPAGPKETK